MDKTKCKIVTNGNTTKLAEYESSELVRGIWENKKLKSMTVSIPLEVQVNIQEGLTEDEAKDLNSLIETIWEGMRLYSGTSMSFQDLKEIISLIVERQK